MSDSVPPPPVPSEVAAAQEPWPVVPAGPASTDPEPPPDERSAPAGATPDETPPGDDLPTGWLLARIAADRLHRLATPVQIGIVVLGTLGAFNALASSGGGASRETLAFLVTVGLLIVVGLVVGHVLDALSALLSAQADQAEAAGRIEHRLATGLDQLAASLASLAAASRTAVSPAVSSLELKVQHLAEIRHAVRTGRWAEADELVQNFGETHPDDPDGARIAGDVARARQEAGQELRARIEAAREVNDPERVIELRDELKPLLAPDAVRSLDRELARWFLLLISRRLRTGTVRADVAVLAARVAESLDDTPEGASLRASLPTLRRAAGLCARCGQPYTGVADACPTCLTGLRTVAISPTPPPPEPAPDGPAS
jgi:hypothetical protein